MPKQQLFEDVYCRTQQESEDNIKSSVWNSVWEKIHHTVWFEVSDNLRDIIEENVNFHPINTVVIHIRKYMNNNA